MSCGVLSERGRGERLLVLEMLYAIMAVGVCARVRGMYTGDVYTYTCTRVCTFGS